MKIATDNVKGANARLPMLLLVLAIGLVVDDAIIVVENIEKFLECGMGPLETTRAAMAEITATIVTIGLVLAAFAPVAFIPPLIQGLSSIGGFDFMIEDREGKGLEATASVTDRFLDAARPGPELAGVFTDFSARVPQLRFDIDRVKARRLGGTDPIGGGTMAPRSRGSVADIVDARSLPFPANRLPAWFGQKGSAVPARGRECTRQFIPDFPLAIPARRGLIRGVPDPYL